MILAARHFAAPALALGFACAFAPLASATPLPTGLSATASVEFDSTFAAGELTGSGAQHGTMSLTADGVVSSTTYSDASTTTGSNPLGATLFVTGDGVGFGGSASAGGTAGVGTFGVGIDFLFSLSNTSANTYRVTFGIAFDNRVNAGGADAFSDSEFSVSDGSSEVFFTDLISDTVNGNVIDGNSTNTAGGVVDDAGLTSFFVDLAPGASLSVDGFWTLRGGAFGTDSTASSFFDVFVDIDSVELLNQPPNPIPLPGTLALLALGLAGLAGSRFPDRRSV